MLALDRIVAKAYGMTTLSPGASSLHPASSLLMTQSDINKVGKQQCSFEQHVYGARYIPWTLEDPISAAVVEKPRDRCKIKSVSYTHLTLPTNREV